MQNTKIVNDAIKVPIQVYAQYLEFLTWPYATSTPYHIKAFCIANQTWMFQNNIKKETLKVMS